MADIVIINPRFDNSFWGMENCIGLLGKRANLPVACLALLAALVPDHHDVRLIVDALAQVEDANGSLPDAGRSFSRARKQPTEAQALAS